MTPERVFELSPTTLYSVEESRCEVRSTAVVGVALYGGEWVSVYLDGGFYAGPACQDLMESKDDAIAKALSLYGDRLRGRV